MTIPLRRYQGLRDIYEDELGESVCDHTWYRTRKRLGLVLDDEYNLNYSDVVRMAAKLRQMHPRKRINRLMVQRALKIQRDFPTDITTNGAELHRMVSKVKGYQIPRQTMYRWGDEIGVKFRTRKWYTPDQLQLWAQKIVPGFEG